MLARLASYHRISIVAAAACASTGVAKDQLYFVNAMSGSVDAEANEFAGEFNFGVSIYDVGLRGCEFRYFEAIQG